MSNKDNFFKLVTWEKNNTLNNIRNRILKRKAMKNYHLILVRHHSRPDGSNCVRLRSDRFEQTIFIPYTNEPDEYTDPKIEAIKYLEKTEHCVIGQAELKNDYVIICDASRMTDEQGFTFKPLK